MVAEIALVERTKRIILKAGGLAVKTHGSTLSQGEPDLYCCYKGFFVAIEMKVPGKKPRPLQYAKLRMWEKAGAVSFWSDNPDEILEVIEQELRAREQGTTTLVNGRPK